MSLGSTVKRLATGIAATALASTMLAGVAFADSVIPTSAESLAVTDSYVTGAAARAAMPSIEILGLAGVEETGNFIDLTTDADGAYTNIYNWSQPKYYLAASKYAGSNKFSPYLANFANGYGTTAQRAVYNSARSGSGAGPNQALGTSTNDTTIAGMAQVVVGNGNNTSSSAVAYDASYYNTLASTMDAIAVKADAAVTTSGKALRFGSASDIATAYRQYIYGTMGAIQKQIDQGNVAQKKVALIQGVTVLENDEGEEVPAFDLMTTSEATAQDGTALVNRYLETVLNTDVTGINLAENYADTQEVVIASELAGKVDLVLVGGQSNSGNYATIMNAILATDSADGVSYNKLLAKTYFVKNNGTYGAMYGVVMNSVENAQNIGRILGCLYPTIINQQSWIAYYYETFYHINPDDLAAVVDNAMDGVRCWAAAPPSTEDEATTWSIDEETDADGDGYNDSFPKTSTTISTSVTNTISNGYAYYQGLQS